MIFHGDDDEAELLVTNVVQDSREAERLKNAIIDELTRGCLRGEEAYRLAGLLPVVLEPEDVSLLHDPRIVSNRRVLPRIIWALGELFNPDLVPDLRCFLDHDDDEVVGIALTAIAKCNPTLADEFAPFRYDRRRLIRKRYVEGFEQLYGICFHEPPGVTFVQVRDASVLAEARHRQLRVADQKNMRLDITHEEVPAVVGEWMGLWETWVVPIAVGVMSAALYDLIKSLIREIHRMREAGENPRINGSFALALARVRLRDRQREPARLRKAVRSRNTTSIEETPRLCLYLIEFDTPEGRCRIVVSNLGDVMEEE